MSCANFVYAFLRYGQRLCRQHVLEFQIEFIFALVEREGFSAKHLRLYSYGNTNSRYPRLLENILFSHLCLMISSKGWLSMYVRIVPDFIKQHIYQISVRSEFLEDRNVLLQKFETLEFSAAVGRRSSSNDIDFQTSGVCFQGSSTCTRVTYPSRSCEISGCNDFGNLMISHGYALRSLQMFSKQLICSNSATKSVPKHVCQQFDDLRSTPLGSSIT